MIDTKLRLEAFIEIKKAIEYLVQNVPKEYYAKAYLIEKEGKLPDLVTSKFDKEKYLLYLNCTIKKIHGIVAGVLDKEQMQLEDYKRHFLKESKT